MQSAARPVKALRRRPDGAPSLAGVPRLDHGRVWPAAGLFLRSVTGHPFAPVFDGETVALGEVLDRHVEFLREAHRRQDRLAAQVLRGTGCARGTDEELLGSELTLEKAQLTIARDHGYADWAAASEHADVRVDTRFEAAVDAIQWGDLAALRALLDAHPALVRMHSSFAHHATLLHHVAANGMEVERQLQSPPNAPQIMRLLLEHGAEPDALSDTYGGGRDQTTLCLLVSSSGPAAAGVEAALVEELCRAGAKVNGLDDDGLPLWTAITCGHSGGAEALARGGARVDNLVFSAALGDLATVRSYFDAGGRLKPERAGSVWRVGAAGPQLPADHLLEYALIWAAGHGRREVVEFLLRKQPDLSVVEPCFGATALGAAKYHRRAEIVSLLQVRGTPS
jgi:ankyrin repeat protein